MRDIKQIVSIRIEDAKREQVQGMATRLHIRESSIYRMAISYTLNKLSLLMDEDFNGSDLIPLIFELREEFYSNLEFNKHQLFTIINSRNTKPDKFVAMADIELLLIPTYNLRPHLAKFSDIQNDNDEIWLKHYLFTKYNLPLNS